MLQEGRHAAGSDGSVKDAAAAYEGIRGLALQNFVTTGAVRLAFKCAFRLAPEQYTPCCHKFCFFRVAGGSLSLGELSCQLPALPLRVLKAL